MFRFLLLLLLIVPAIELWGMISVGKIIGGWSTVALVILTGIVGAWMTKRQGLQVLKLVQIQLSRHQMPADALLDGLLILFGGLLLLTPGFFTDAFGFILLIPYTRMIIRHFFRKWIWFLISSGKIRIITRR